MKRRLQCRVNDWSLCALAVAMSSCSSNVRDITPVAVPATSTAKADQVVARQREAVLDSAPSARAKLSYNDLYFIQNETWISEGSTPLGTIFVIRPTANEGCSSSAPKVLQETEHFVPASLNSPTQPEKLKTILVDRSAAAELNILSFVSGTVGADDVLSLTMTTQPRGVVRDTKWSLELQKLKSQNPQLWTENCLVGIVTNMTRRTLVYRKYSKLAAEGTGGAYGVKVGGKYYTSDLDEEVSYVFGLNLVPLDPPSQQPASPELQPAAGPNSGILQSVKEVRLLNYGSGG